jgi:hypothetical protein
MPQSAPRPDRTTSKLGIASLALAVGFPFLLLVLLVISMILDGRVDYHYVKKLDLFLGLLAIIGGPIVHFTALVLGIVGAFQKRNKKLFPILGIVFNGVLLLAAAIISIFFLSLIFAALGTFH